MRFQSTAHASAFADFIIECEGNEFPCHRFVLANRSVAFDALFKSPMTESKEGKMSVKDYEPQAVRGFLNLIYSDSAAIGAETDPGVYLSVSALAHKYLVSPGRTFQEMYNLISLSTTTTNVLDIAQFAFDHHIPSLREEVVYFIFVNLPTILKTPKLLKSLPMNCRKRLLDLLILCHSPVQSVEPVVIAKN